MYLFSLSVRALVQEHKPCRGSIADERDDACEHDCCVRATSVVSLGSTSDCQHMNSYLLFMHLFLS